MDNDDNDNTDDTPEPLYRNGVDLSEPGAQQYWCNELGCKPAVLGAAVRMAGSSSVAAVSAAINCLLERQKERDEPDGCSPG